MHNRTDGRIAWALFGLMTAIYLFTFGGHTYSPDEEMFYYVTEGIVERRSFVVPAQGATVTVSPGAIGRDGENYSKVGLLPSVLAIPFYLAGRLVSTAFAPWFQPYWTRFFVCMLNGLVGGGTAALMYLLGRMLGYRRSTSLFLSLGLGLATFVAIYARTFFSESLLAFCWLLSVWAALSYRRSRQRGWAVLLGLALGLSFATKTHAVVAVPGSICYLVIIMFEDHTDWHARLRWLGETALLCVIGGLLPVSLVLGYNYLRFGDGLETGYVSLSAGAVAGSAFRGSALTGLYGMLFSTGRGFFLYAPLAVLGIVGTRTLSRRHNAETWLLWLVSLSHLLLYAMVKRAWWTGGSWGPRSLTYIVPLILLPAGAFLESQAYSRRLRISVASSLFLIGLLVQTGAVLTNFNSYYNQDWGDVKVSTSMYLYNPKYSAAWGQWRLWSERYEKWKQYQSALAEYEDSKYTASGWLQPIKAEDLAPFGRWTKGSVAVDMYTLPEESLEVTVTYWRPLDEGVPQDPLVFSIDGQELKSSSSALGDSTSGRHADTVSVTAEEIATFPPKVAFDSTLWSPAAVGISADDRDMGVFIETVSVRVDGREMQVGGTEPLFPRLPINASLSWSGRATWWFWRLDAPHLVDTWWWYVSVIGLLPSQVRTVQWVGLLVIGLIGGASVYLLVAALKRSSSNCAASG